MPKKTDLLLKFGERIRDLRKQKSISQEDLAFKAGVHRTYIGMIERGKKNITLENINKLAIALDISIADLLQNF
jgi:transcriptional regulator with XRE-family HTH domain